MDLEPGFTLSPEGNVVTGRAVLDENTERGYLYQARGENPELCTPRGVSLALGGGKPSLVSPNSCRLPTGGWWRWRLHDARERHRTEIVGRGVDGKNPLHAPSNKTSINLDYPAPTPPPTPC